MDATSTLPAEWLLAIPPSYLAAIIAVLGVIVASSWLVALLKRLTGLPTEHDSVAKQRWFKVLRVLDYVASNSATVQSWFVELEHERKLAAARKAIEEHRATIADQERDIRVQAAVIRASQRPPDNDNGSSSGNQGAL